MKKIKKIRKKRIISLFLLVCLITITLTFAIYRESISKLLNLNLVHPSYTVTFDANGGSVSTASKSVTYKHQYGELPTPTRDEYQFKGWNGKNMLNYNNIQSEAASRGITVDDNGNISDSSPSEDGRGWSAADNQNWIVNLPAGTYSLSLFFSQVISSTNGSNYSGVGIRNMDTNTFIYVNGAGLLYNKTNYNYTFTLSNETNIGILIKAYEGVYRIQLEQGSTATAYEPYYITSSTEVVQAQDHTLTAIWEENPYTVTFDANGGTVSKASKKVKDGDEYGTLPTPTRDGYTFKGWNGKNMVNVSSYTNKSLLTQINNVKVIFDGSSVNNNVGNSIAVQKYNDKKFIDHIRIIANASTGFYSCSFVKDSTFNKFRIKINTTAADPYIEYDLSNLSDGTYTLSFNVESIDLQNAKATLSNIQLEEGSTATPYEPYYITSSTEVVQAQNHTLKAIWEPNTYTVSFNKNDNSASGSMSNISMTYDVSSTLPSNSFTKTGYKFVGWNTKADGSGTTYSDGATVSNLTTTNNATVTLYAQWKRVMANNVEYDEPEVNCNNVQCMIDELYDMLY